jgi:hypothetical protein
MDPELTTLIARPRAWQRWSRWPGVLLLVVGLWSLAYGFEPLALAVIAVGFWGTSEIWRGVRVTGDTLIAQGRLSRRSIPLAEIAQVGRAKFGAVWVRPCEGRTLVLHQAELRMDEPGTIPDIEARLRELAQEAGAELGPELEEPMQPPRPSTPFFGW